MDWFATRLLDWFDAHGRRDLPWQRDTSAYRVWVSEIMLQQTQVATVIPYYRKFMARFPAVADLAAAELDDVLHHWTGLGYYARGRNLHKAAQKIMTDFNGTLPLNAEALESLPGIGRSTAGAIAAIAGNRRAPILDGNVKRVLSRYHAVAGYPGEAAVAKTLWARADEHTPTERVADYTQAIMDLGATLCVRTRPDCSACPLATRCRALAANQVNRYPGRKPKRDKPVREARLFVVHDSSGACLLEQRPASGIWGGLWTPPERPRHTAAKSLLQEFGLTEAQTSGTYEAPCFRHTFTHFHLHIEPIYIRVSAAPLAVRDRDDVRWYRPGSNEPLGLAAPAVKLLASLPEISRP